MSIKLVGDWGKASRLLLAAPAAFRRAEKRAVLQEAQFFRTKIVEGIRKQAPGGKRFLPLKKTTIEARVLSGLSRRTKALIVRGDLRNSITVVEQRQGAFVGILKTARGKGGQSLVNIAKLNEFGSRTFVVRPTRKQWRFLHALFARVGRSGGGGGGGGGVIVIRIPPRPFLRPVFDKFGKRGAVSRRFIKRLSILLAGKYGRV